MEEKKVSYKIFDIDLPETFSIEERELKELKKKKEIGWDTGITQNEAYFIEIEKQKIQSEYELEFQHNT